MKKKDDTPPVKPDRFQARKVTRNPKGRPHADGTPASEKSKALPLKVRRDIKRMLIDGSTVAQIQLKYKRYKPTKAQIDAIKYDRVKLVSEPRIDAYDYPQDTKIRRYSDINEGIRDQLLDAVNLLETNTKKALEKLEGLTYISLVNQRLTRASVVSALGRRDANTVLAIIRMYEPNVTEEQAIAIYRQAQTQMKNDDE